MGFKETMAAVYASITSFIKAFLAAGYILAASVFAGFGAFTIHGLIGTDATASFILGFIACACVATVASRNHLRLEMQNDKG